MINLYEKLGLFYLGRDVDKNSQEATDALSLLKNKNFTTHATIIGMTGSGKTGLGIGIIEEASIDNIPAIVIDPKGDMGNLLLTDPEFSSDSFEPWVRDEANTKGVDSKEYAKKNSYNLARGYKKRPSRQRESCEINCCREEYIYSREFYRSIYQYLRFTRSTS
jgi:hypothetical protein